MSRPRIPVAPGQLRKGPWPVRPIIRSVALCCYAFIVAERARRFPPRPEGRLKPTRSRSKPERHVHDSFITARLAMARMIATWLPRCPTCHRSNHQRASRSLPGLFVHPSGP